MRGWDLVISHPPCTYLCSSGLHWNKRRPEREESTQNAALFFLEVVRRCNSFARSWAIENPVGCMSRLYRRPDQYVQPYEYGDDASKRTCLWLHNLMPLRPTRFVTPRLVDGKPRYANQTDSGQNKLPPSKDRSKLRSKTYQGIADAMAEQWTQPKR